MARERNSRNAGRGVVMLRKLVVVVLLTLFTSACANQAVFLSDPPGARVTIDGKLVGTTPCKFDYNNSAGEDYEVTVSKEGYGTVRHEIKAVEVDRGARSKLLTAGLIIPGGSALMLGALFTKKLKDNYEFVLEESPLAVTARAESVGEKTF
jgi:hypothetical protein